jgi:hypothetical protein
MNLIRLVGSLAILLILGAGALLFAPGAARSSASLTRGDPARPLQGTPTATVIMPSPCGWSFATSPNIGSYDNVLQGVAMVAPNDGWAVGNYSPGVSNSIQTLVEHWDGTQWQVVPSPNVGSSNNFLYGVAARSANDVWAVGTYAAAGNVEQTLIVHWDGTQWLAVPSPNVASARNYLHSVAIVAANDVWAVGDYASASFQTLIEHWNGTQWQIVSSPNLGPSYNFLYGGGGADRKRCLGGRDGGGR